MSTIEQKIAIIKERFLQCIDRLADPSPPNNHVKTEKLIPYCYNFSRLLRIYPTKFDFSSQEKENFIHSYPIAVESVLKCINTVYSLLNYSQMNELKGYRSSIRFLKTDIFKLYKKLSNGNIPDDLTEKVQRLRFIEGHIATKIFRWKRDGDGYDNPNEVPNLNGVPKKHKWWTKRYRNLWRNKDAFECKVVFFMLYE